MFILAVAVVTGILFGLAPALQVSTRGVHEMLKDTSRGATEGKRRAWVRSALVVSEVAFACVLLVGAGLLIRSFLRVLDVNIGFRPESAAAVRVDPDRKVYDTRDKINGYLNEALRRVREIPGVTAAGISDQLPLGRNRTWGVGVKGRTFERGQSPSAFIRIVSDGYIKAMGIPLISGRDISERDVGEASPTATDLVIVINQTMAQRLFPGEDAVGKTIFACGPRQVVGVVGDVRHLALEQGSGNEVYIPMRQCGDLQAMDLVVRSTKSTGDLATAVRGALKPISPGIAGADFRPLQRLVDKAVSSRKFTVMLLGGFALFALILASLGIYGVISYSVSQRTQEIGIRMALGASAGRLQAKIVLHTLGLAGIGMLVGTVASWRWPGR
jgi:predicted permease